MLTFECDGFETPKHYPFYCAVFGVVSIFVSIGVVCWGACFLVCAFLGCLGGVVVVGIGAFGGKVWTNVVSSSTDMSRRSWGPPGYRAARRKVKSQWQKVC